ALIRLLPQAGAEIRALAAEHETSLFTPRPGDEQRAWRLQWRIYLLAVLRRLNLLEEPPAP
ncbi:MAG: hypothetical protein WHV44_09315, partial [Anaerolineales bacterium]